MKTEIVFILDQSGSMYSIYSDAIGGFNSFIKSQKEVEGECLFSAVLFDTTVKPLYSGIDLKEVVELTEKTYKPNGGTALLDAIGMTIDSTGSRLRAMKEVDRPDKILFVILTDGEENSSRAYTSEKVAEMIKHQREKYSWEFLFLAANQDAITAGNKLNIVNNYNFAASAQGIRSAYASTDAFATSYRVNN